MFVLMLYVGCFIRIIKQSSPTVRYNGPCKDIENNPG